jgi:MarR family 2-MHQ and catechol resistance regulon transcriptional repressor
MSAARTDSLLDALAHEVGAVFHSINRIAQPELLGTLDEVDLSISQVKALFALDRAGPLAGTALARELQLSPAATSRAADGLVLAGLVTRIEAADDRRVRMLEITAAGRELVSRIGGVRNDAMEQVLGLLDAGEQARLLKAIAPLAERARTVAAGAAS